MKPLPWPATLALELVVAVLSGIALAYVSAPVNLHALQWVVYVPMMLILGAPRERLGARAWLMHRHTWIAVVYGVCAQAAIFWWIIDTITDFSNIPWIAAAGILGLFAVVFGTPYMLLWWSLPTLRRQVGPLWVLGLPAAMVVIEWLGTWIILFPYHQGVAQYRVLPTFQIVGVTGIWGVTFLVLFVNAAIAEVVFARREGRGWSLAWLGVAAGLWGLTNVYGFARLRTIDDALAEAPELKVFQIQDHIDMHERMRSFPCALWNFWYDASNALETGQVDLVVWPEGAGVYRLNTPHRARRYRNAECEDIDAPLERLKELSAKLDADLLIGSTATELVKRGDGKTDRRNLNSVYQVQPDGQTARYDKIIPLPFGEYIPFSNTFPFLRELIDGPGNFQAGTEPIVFEGKARISTPICYEAILPHLCRRYPQPDLLVNGTLDTWFGDTAAPHQHAMLASIRTVELGIPLVRSAYTGVSMVVEPSGRIYAETEPFERVSRIVTVRLANVPTVYRTLSAYGLQDWFVWLCLGGLLFGRLAAPWWARRHPSPDAGHAADKAPR